MIFSDYNKLNITFCGMMGSGKSIIGKKFAKIIDFKFLDTDAFIEKKTSVKRFTPKMRKFNIKIKIQKVRDMNTHPYVVYRL